MKKRISRLTNKVTRGAGSGIVARVRARASALVLGVLGVLAVFAAGGVVGGALFVPAARAVRDVAAGAKHSVFVSNDGRIYTAGNNAAGQLGLGTTVGEVLVPTEVKILGLSQSVEYAEAGGNNTVYVTKNAGLFRFGGSKKYVPAKIETMHDFQGYISLRGTKAFISYWNTQGQPPYTGFKFDTSETNPVIYAYNYKDGRTATSGGVFMPMRVAQGLNYELFIDNNGALLSRGESNESGQLGDGGFTPRLTPREVFDANDNDRSYLTLEIAAGEAHSLFIVDADKDTNTENDGKVFAFGRNDRGQLGIGNSAVDGTTSSAAPREVKTADEKGFDDPSIGGAKSVVAGQNHSFIITNSGRLFAFGDNHYGQLGIGVAEDNTHAVPIEITLDGNPVKVVSLAAGDNHTLAVLEIGAGEYAYFAWGDNSAGQLGLGYKSETPVATPTRVYLPPAINVNPTTINNWTAGDAFSFAVSASADSPISYQWQKSTDNGLSWVDIAGATAPVLEFNNPTYADIGKYRARVSCSVGTGQNTSTASVYSAAAAFTGVPENALPIVTGSTMVRRGASFQFRTTDDGDCTWYVIGRSAYDAGTGTGTRIDSTGNLTVSAAEGARYLTVIAVDQANESRFRSVLVHVTSPTLVDATGWGSLVANDRDLRTPHDLQTGSVFELGNYSTLPTDDSNNVLELNVRSVAVTTNHRFFVDANGRLWWQNKTKKAVREIRQPVDTDDPAKVNFTTLVDTASSGGNYTDPLYREGKSLKIVDILAYNDEQGHSYSPGLGTGEYHINATTIYAIGEDGTFYTIEVDVDLLNNTYAFRYTISQRETTGTSYSMPKFGALGNNGYFITTAGELYSSYGLLYAIYSHGLNLKNDINVDRKTINAVAVANGYFSTPEGYVASIDKKRYRVLGWNVSVNNQGPFTTFLETQTIRLRESWNPGTDAGVVNDTPSLGYLDDFDNLPVEIAAPQNEASKPLAVADSGTSIASVAPNQSTEAFADRAGAYIINANGEIQHVTTNGREHLFGSEWALNGNGDPYGGKDLQEGFGTTFKANVAAAIAPVEYTWLRNGYPVEPQPETGDDSAHTVSWKIDAFTWEDDGAVYTLQITDALGKVFYVDAQMTVRYAPRLSDFKVNGSLLDIENAEKDEFGNPVFYSEPGAGGSITLTGTVAGNPKPGYIWQTYNNETQKWEDLNVSTGTLPLNNLRYHSNGKQYRLGGTSSLGTQYSLALTTLRGIEAIAPGLSWGGLSDNQTRYENQSAMFVLKIDRGDGPFTIEWYLSKQGLQYDEEGNAFLPDDVYDADGHAVPIVRGEGNNTFTKKVINEETAEGKSLSDYYSTPLLSYADNGNYYIAKVTGVPTKPAEIDAPKADKVTFLQTRLNVEYAARFSPNLPATTDINPDPDDDKHEVTITANVDANPVPEIVWQRSNDGGLSWIDLDDGVTGAGIIITGSHTSSLSMQNVRYADNKALFRVKATNSRDIKYSAATQLIHVHTVQPILVWREGTMIEEKTGAGGPTFYQVVAEGQAATLRVNVLECDPPLVYNWERSTDGGVHWSKVPNAENYESSTEYKTPTLPLSLDGVRYRVIASDGAIDRDGVPVPEAEKKSVTLEAEIRVVNAHEAVLDVPPETEPVNGETILEVVFDGRTTPHYQWQTRENENEYWEDIPGETSDTLKLVDLRYADNGRQFRVYVGNDQPDGTGTYGAITTLVNIPPPTPIVAWVAKSETVLEGQHATFWAYVPVGYPPDNGDFIYEWFQDGVKFTEVGSDRAAFTSPQPLTYADNGTVFTVRVTGVTDPKTGDPTQGEASVTVTVTPLSEATPTPPKFTNTLPATVELADDGSLTLAVTVEGNPAPTYQWQINKKINSTNESDWLDLSGMTSPVLSLAGLDNSANGWRVRCIITNPHGSKTSTETRIIVPGAGDAGSGSGDNYHDDDDSSTGTGTGTTGKVTPLPKSAADTLALIRDGGASLSKPVKIESIITDGLKYNEETGEYEVVSTPVTLGVRATGGGQLYYQWYRKNDAGEGEAIPGAVYPTLVLDYTDYAPGRFYVVVSNRAGTSAHQEF